MVQKETTKPPDGSGEKEKKMTIDIICPNCNFSKKIPKEKIPMGVKWATCPNCKNRFEFVAQELDLDFEGEQEKRDAESRAGRVVPPWENRSELGTWQGIYKTFKAVLFSPEDLFGTMIFKGGLKEPLAFGLLLGSVGTMFGFFWQFLMMSGKLLPLSHALLGRFTMGLIFLGIIILSPIFVAINMLITGGIMHLCLLIVRGAKNGFEGTFRVVAYSQATQILGLIPFIGGLIGWFWHLIVQVIGIREIHEISYLRVIIAFLIPLVFIVLLAVMVLIPLLIFGSHRIFG